GRNVGLASSSSHASGGGDRRRARGRVGRRGAGGGAGARPPARHARTPHAASRRRSCRGPEHSAVPVGLSGGVVRRNPLAARERSIVYGAAILLPLPRGLVPPVYEGFYSASDQAIVGLMARHISTLHDFPVYYYSLNYLLAVQAWIIAPFF